MVPSLRVAAQTLRANPVRTLLSTLGIVMGAGSLVAVLSLGDGAEQFARQQIERRGLQVISVAPKTSDTVDGLTIPRTSFPIFSVDHAAALSRALMPGSAVILTIEGTGTFVTRPDGPGRAALVTGVSGSPIASGMNMAHGRFLSDDEMQSGALSIVVSHRMASELTGNGNPSMVVGRTLTLQGQAWTIVGVLAAFPGERTFGILVPFAASGRAMVPVSAMRPSTMLVRAPRIEDVTPVRTQVERWADATEPRWRTANEIAIGTTGLDRLQQLNQGMLIFKMLMGAFTSFILQLSYPPNPIRALDNSLSPDEETGRQLFSAVNCGIPACR